jgi:hypothetical protein
MMRRFDNIDSMRCSMTVERRIVEDIADDGKDGSDTIWLD